VVKGRKVRIRKEKDRVTLLIMRTVAISLAYLGDPDAGRHYVLQLLSDSRQDRLNRGFHLDYYGDQEFSRTATNLVSDDAGRPCPRTFDQLRNRLLSDRENPIYEIELQTLCSLAQHRHVAGTLERADAEMIQGVIDHALRKKRATTAELRSYIRMIRDDLAVEQFKIARVYDTFHRVKMVPRSGWRVRGLPHAESVADHMYAVYMLGMLFLPDTWNAPGYSKPRIIQMILGHDLAEAVIGDLLPHQKSPIKDRQESLVHEKLSMSGTYEGLARTQIVGAWQEFRGKQSANAKIAHELDKLENLVQLWVYRILGNDIPGYEEWESNLRDEVTTDLGTQILQDLEDYYLPRLNDPALGLMMPPPPPDPDPSAYL
jgi:5'-deoxynucleotidase YfbR-like HD superfamily hydrolase